MALELVTSTECAIVRTAFERSSLDASEITLVVRNDVPASTPVASLAAHLAVTCAETLRDESSRTCI